MPPDGASSSTALLTVVPLLAPVAPSALLLAMLSTPPLTVAAPVKLLAPERVTVLPVVLFKPALPASLALTVPCWRSKLLPPPSVRVPLVEVAAFSAVQSGPRR